MWDLIVSVPDHCLSFYFSYATLKRIKHFRKYTQILLFNNNADAKAYSFIFIEDI